MDKERMKILIDGIENGLSNKELVMLSKYTSSYIRKVERNIEKYKSLISENPPKRKRKKKENIDKENKNGMYWLIGSQQFHLMKNVSESLAGRVGIINLNSFMYSEIVKNKKSDNSSKIANFKIYKIGRIKRFGIYKKST